MAILCDNIAPVNIRRGSYERVLGSFWVTLLTATLVPVSALARQPEIRLAQVTVRTDREACEVTLDAAAASKTDARGNLVLRDVDPSDHYIHVHCPGDEERGYFVSPRSGESVEVRVEPGGAASSPDPSALSTAEVKIELRRLVNRAVQLRAQGRFEEAVRDLREAFKLDAENSDLHRELGITFLLDKDWKRARVEMLEAIRHQPDDADAHNGLGYALEKLGDVRRATQEYRTATRLDPDDSSYRQHYLEALGKLAAEQAPKKNSSPLPEGPAHRR